jgi:cobalamin-dependent methionine synthase I
MEKRAAEALELLAKVVNPSAQALTGLILPGKLEDAFKEHLRGSVSWTILMATLGGETDECLKRLQMGGEHLAAHMFNAAASEAVELLAGNVHLRMAADMQGMNPTARFAPGYGSVPLSAQKNLVELFPGMGVECTDSFYMTPSKTMTAVWGWMRQKD